jgi:hypothetical protein
MMKVLFVSAWLALFPQIQASHLQEAWLRGFEGEWVVDNPKGADARILLVITRESSSLVLKVTLGIGDVVTRYDLSGIDVVNTFPGGPPGVYRSRIGDDHKIRTELWNKTDKASGPPQTFETRYLESADVMVTELSKTAQGAVFNRTLMRRKPK